MLGTTLTQTWSALTPGFRILNGYAQADSTGARAAVNAGSAFGTMEVVLGNSASTTGLIFRVVNANNYFGLAADESGFYALRKVVNGVVNPLEFSITRASVRPTAGDVVRLMSRPDDGVFVAAERPAGAGCRRSSFHAQEHGGDWQW